ncbi:uroporphyrinogen-III synthase [Constrictibacter sp. MBR-5]|jgi:uroporphyrinogen-III synthase|uniref:uroporphyrinogen-III synthase n=1 Tax=Constrictibacter sp. MBR-5 TaxID=3156467 RepID=UPI0033950E52
MRALITRPRENAGAIARALSERDIEPIQEPLLEIRATDHGPIDLDGVQAVLLTSAFGAREFATSTERRDLPIFAVGDATADAARNAGFDKVESARGDAEALAMLVMEKLKPADGALLHAGGRTIAGDLAGQLGEAGYEVRRVELYSALPAPALSIETIEALKSGGLDLVLFFSPRTAGTFVRLVQEAGVADRCAQVTALCLSAQVAEAARGVGWRRVEIADRPEQPAMIALVDRWLETGTMPPQDEQSQPAAEAAASAAEPVRKPEIRWEQKDQAQRASPPPQPQRRRGVGSGVVAALLVLLALATGVLGYMLWDRQEQLRVAMEQGQRSRIPTAEITDLQGRIGSAEARMTENLSRIEQRLGDRLDALESRITEVAARDQGQPDLEARIDDLQAKLTAVQDARGALQDQLSAVEQSTGKLGDRLTTGLADIEKQVTAATEAAQEATREAARDRTAAMLMALNGVRDALAEGAPFDTQVSDLRKLGQNEPAVAEALSGWADRAAAGIPTRPQLTKRFKEIASEVGGRIRPQTGEGWLDSMIERATSVVRVRRVGEDAAGDTPDAVLARAEAAMDNGNLAKAVDEVGALQGEPAAAFADWLADAKARLAVADGLERLEKAALAVRGAG